tara:strand:+ start:742 stop:1269 length:528 start_codon:yes stop_codon:yes gene_type:complete
MKITKKFIDNFRYKGDGVSQDIRWDDQLSGFGIRLYPTGKKSFVLSYRLKGRKHIMTVGKYGVLTLDQGRAKAKVLLVSIDQGGNPLYERKKLNQGKTIANLSEAYLERHAMLHKKTWRDDQRRINAHILPKWKGVQINSIKREDIAMLHHTIGKDAPRPLCASASSGLMRITSL